ncbi:unnamed protein product [Acanthoscelides obtectus]|uniref:Uncharacterized protein n=1 Tax=Acanthoscelides obtectus TaxID=200917 RepID=A0A9P0Q5D7_ACAOB|nr:unnamed protein product [Acanthoscelides obtectus]CAK1624298.1 hypothetical protein AOBTE_LOCUS2480 [Acanthoscelides obtectus]
MKEEIAIQKVRTMEKLSYLEAKKKVIRPIPQKSYSEIAATTKTSFNPEARITPMQDLVRQWKAKPLHGQYRSRIEDNAIDTKASQGWLQSDISELSNGNEEANCISTEDATRSSYEGTSSGEHIFMSAPSWAENWKSFLLMIEKHNLLLESLQEALSGVRGRMLKNNPQDVKMGVEKAFHLVNNLTSLTKDLKGRGESFQKELAITPRESLRYRPRAASTGTAIVRPRGEKREASRTPEEKRDPNKGKTDTLSQPASKASPGQSQDHHEQGNNEEGFQVVTNRKKEGRKVQKEKRKEKVASKEHKADKEGRAAPSNRTRKRRTSEAVKVTAVLRSFADILKTMKAKVNPAETETELLSIRRTRDNDMLFVLKKGGKASEFAHALAEAVKEKAEVKSLTLFKTLELRDLDETVTVEEVINALHQKLDKDAVDMNCRLFSRRDAPKVALIKTSELDAEHLLKGSYWLGELQDTRACRSDEMS